MKQRFTKRVDKLRNDCLEAISNGWVGNSERIEPDGRLGYYLDDNCEYDAIVWTNGSWHLAQNGYYYDIYTVPIETLCNYVDYIIETYKL